MDKEYSRRLDKFLGVDFSSAPSNVSTRRFSFLKNMYRDYESELGDAVETVPGFRCLKKFPDGVNGMYAYKPVGEDLQVVVHAGKKIYVFNHSDRDVLHEAGKVTEYSGIADAKSQALMFNNRLYLLDGSDYWVLTPDSFGKVSADAYLPITYVNGEQYEQRNMLNPLVINRDTQMAEFAAAEILNIGTNTLSGWKEGYSSEYLVTKTASNLQFVASEAFLGDTRLKKAYLVGVSQLRARSFEGCTSLEEVRLYSTSDYNAASSSPDAFKNCTALKTVYLSDLMSIGEYDEDTGKYSSIFDGCTAIETVYAAYSEEEYDAQNPDYYLSSFFPSGATIVFNAPTPGVGEFRYAMCYDPADSIERVKVDGEETSDYFEIYNTIDGETYVDRIVTFEDWTDNEVDIVINCKPTEFNTYEGYIGFLDGNTDYKGGVTEAVTKCRLISAFDGRVFFSGNPDLPNTVFYTQRDLTGFANPTYVGALNYVNDGTGAAVNTALLPTSGMLMVLKGDTVQDGSVYYHTGADSQSDIIPRVYPSTQGIAGVGCVGAATNFRDDPVFLSRGGLEAVGKQQVNLERTISHRSSYVDRLLVAENLEDAVLCEWRKYLCVFCPSGAVYLADSRQLFEHSSGDAQYEWYYMDDVGVYSGQTQMYKTTTGRVPAYYGGEHWLNEIECWVIHGGERKRLHIATAQSYLPYEDVYTSFVYIDEGGADVYFDSDAEDNQLLAYVAEIGGLIYLVEPDTEAPYSGGVFSPAVSAVNIDEVLYFGTENGDICCFNTDQRGKRYGNDTVASDAIHHHWYTFNGRTIHSALSTAHDAAGYPDLAKSTSSKSMVLHTKAFTTSQFNVYVRTDRADTWKSIARISNSIAQFEALDFSNLALKVANEGQFTVREKEKKWAKKQYYLDAMSHMSPFGLYHIGYRFTISGRIK